MKKSPEIPQYQWNKNMLRCDEGSVGNFRILPYDEERRLNERASVPSSMVSRVQRFSRQLSPFTAQHPAQLSSVRRFPRSLPSTGNRMVTVHPYAQYRNMESVRVRQSQRVLMSYTRCKPPRTTTLNPPAVSALADHTFGVANPSKSKQQSLSPSSMDAPLLEAEPLSPSPMRPLSPQEVEVDYRPMSPEAGNTHQLVMYLELSGFRDAAFQRVNYQNANRRGSGKKGMYQFKQIEDFPRVSVFRKWFESVDGRLTWRLIGRVSFAMKPVEMHIYMCREGDSCPCLLAIRYSLLFDDIRVFISRRHTHIDKSKVTGEEDEDVQVLSPPLNQQSPTAHSPSSATCGKSGANSSAVSPTTAEKRSPTAAERTLTVNGVRRINRLSGSCDGHSSDTVPMDDLLSKVLQEVDIDLDFEGDVMATQSTPSNSDPHCSYRDEADSGGSSESAHTKNSKLANEQDDVDVVCARPRTVSHVSNSPSARAFFPLHPGMLPVEYERSTASTSSADGQFAGVKRKRRVWRFVARNKTGAGIKNGTVICSSNGLPTIKRGTIQIRRVASVRDASGQPISTSINSTGTVRRVFRASAPQFSTQEMSTDAMGYLSLGQLEAMRRKRMNDISIKHLTEDPPAEEGIMADLLMDDSDATAVGFDQPPNRAADYSESRVHGASLRVSSRRDMVNSVVTLMKCSLTVANQKICIDRVLDQVDRFTDADDTHHSST